jgi:hypothetical protein
VTQYEKASPASQQLTDALHRDLSALLPTTNRNNADSLTSFGATGYSKFAFTYLSKKSEAITVYFYGNVDEPPSQVLGMPEINRRNKMDSPWAQITPFFVSIHRLTEIAPFARFLINYSLPKAVSKRSGQTRSMKRGAMLPEEVSAKLFSEGHATQITVNRYERDPQARAACLQHHGTRCAACGISMDAVYGNIAHGFIHVHHLVPLSFRKKGYAVNPKLDLIPLCPNCHAVTHLANPPLSLEQLKLKITKS